MHKNPAYMAPTDQTIQLVKASIELGMPAYIMGAVVTLFRADQSIPLAVLRYTFGPLILHETQKGDGAGDIGWLTADVIKRWRPRVDLERLEIFCGQRPDLVSPAEIWLVMFNATMDSPLRHAVTQIYLWAAARAAVAAGMELPSGIGRSNTQKLATDGEIFDGYLADDYRRLCREIITKVVRHSDLGREGRKTSAQKRA